ncbi:hypothetical protein DdX_13636 [Ditylenchus destructor]|uniref:Uncharacterized protein n=1 Tax=Ditylenchus destructor TaxID=166010 RepID=A0AAD4R2N7_9BILA|nr:hypothetical protein DdX_13636 [Ditylenchus destructor]
MQQNSLLLPNELRNCLQDESKIPLIRTFARYLAAYFLDLPLINANDSLDGGNNSKRTKLFLGNETPNLFVWSSENCHFDETNRTHRSILAADLPPEYSPALVVHLLCRCECWLEAILFLDHFNDFRSQLILRQLYDQRNNFSLFNEHCHNCLVDSFLQTIQEFRAESTHDLQRMSKMIENYVDAAVQIDVVFGSALVECLKNRTMELLDEELLNMINSEVDNSVQLPRPPLYSMPSDCSAEIPEIITWNRCHYFFKTLIACFNQTNQLQALIAHTSTWLADISQSFIQNRSHFLLENSDNDDLAENDLVIFETAILWVLQMTLRDKSSLAQRRIAEHLEEISEEYDIIDEELSKSKRKLGALIVDNYAEDAWQNRKSIQRWVEEMADESDIEVIRTVINFLLESNPRTEMYLPPLNEKSRHKWKNVITAHVDISKKRGLESDACCVSNFFPGTDKCKLVIDTDKWLELQFVLQRLPFIELTDPTLIQISVAIQPNDFAQLEENERTAHVTFEEEKECEHNANQDAATNRHCPNSDIFRDVRSTISRISQIGVTKNGKSVIHSHNETLNEMLQDYRLRKFQKEIEKERRFLETATLNSSEIDDGKSSSIENMNFAGMKYRLRLMEEKFRTNKKHRMNHITDNASPSGSSRQSNDRSQSSSSYPEEVKVMMLEKEIANITKELAKLRQEVQIQQTENDRISSTRRSGSGHNSPISKSSESKTKTTQTKKEVAQKNNVSEKNDEPHPVDQSEKISAKSKPSTGYYSSEAQEFPTTPATLPSSLTSLSDDDEIPKPKVHRKKSKKNAPSSTPNEKSMPDGGFHLDFTGLNSSPERRRKAKMHKEWHDLEIYPRESKSGKASNQDREIKSARLFLDQPQSPFNGEMPRYDSGFIDQKELSVSNATIGDHAADELRDINVQSLNPIERLDQNGTQIFSFDISQARAKELLNLYHSQIERSNE